MAEVIGQTKRTYKLLSYILLTITFLGVYAYSFDLKLAVLGDNAYYYILGKALTQMKGYVNISSPGHPPHNHYPPGYPALIAFIMFFNSSIITIKLMNGMMLLLSLWMLFEIILKETENLLLAFLSVFFIALNSHLLWYSSIMMSEVPFVFFSVLSLYCFLKVDTKSPSLVNPYLLLSILTLLFAYYIRSLGITLLGGYLLLLIIKKNYKVALLYTGTFITGILPWYFRSRHLGGGAYLKQLSMINPYEPELGMAGITDFLERIMGNFNRYVAVEIPRAIFPVIGSPNYNKPVVFWEWMPGLILIGIIIYGICKLTKYSWLIGGYVLCNFLILMIWPEVWVGVRFIVPIIPFLILGFVHGLYKLISLTRLNVNNKLLPIALCLLAALSFIPIKHLHVKARAPYEPVWDNYFKTGEWLKENTDRNAVVSCGKPGLLYMFSNTYTMRYQFAKNPEELLDDLDKNKVDFVVIDQVYANTFHYLLPAVRQHPERFAQVLHLKNPDTFLLKYKRR